jgi:hypothetical protein
MKKIFFSVIAVFLSGFAFSQTFTQGVGINIVLQSASGVNADPVGAIIYSPRVNVMEMENTSLSIGIPMSFGISGSYNSMDAGNSTLGVMFDAPLMINYNYGAGSLKEAEDKFGFYGGVGFGYHMNQYVASDAYGNDLSARRSGFGPVGNIGARLGVGHGSHNLEIRLSYMKTLDESKSNIVGIGFLFNF